MSKKKILSIIGARPQIIKAAALSRTIKKHFSAQLEERIIHTGQHYDANMSAVFFEELDIAQPHYNLGVGSGSHANMTAAILIGLEEIFLKEQPSAVVVYGDTNSTIAAALAAAKIHIPVVHIEAGLRSFQKAMPEEINRIATDHMSTLLFVPTQTGMTNLAKEGFDFQIHSKATINTPNVYHCGDIMYDNSLYFAELSKVKSRLLEQLGLSPEHFILCTIHRSANTDDPHALQAIFEALLELINRTGLPIVLPMHPRTKNKMEALLSKDFQEKIAAQSKLITTEPASFLDMIALEQHASLIMTDSGGVQKEAYFFTKPCVILREQTEWTELVTSGAAKLCGADRSKIVDAAIQLMTTKIQTDTLLYGNGQAAKFICEKILSDL